MPLPALPLEDAQWTGDRLRELVEGLVQVQAFSGKDGAGTGEALVRLRAARHRVFETRLMKCSGLSGVFGSQSIDLSVATSSALHPFSPLRTFRSCMNHAL